MPIELPGPKLSNLTMYDIFENMEPVDCGSCGKILCIMNAYASKIIAPGSLICPKCHKEEVMQNDILEEIEYIEESIEIGMIGKREGKNKIKELKLKLIR